ncbi:M20 aminoacylase family protein [Pseudoroseicyclus sp. CXY001]|uniref:M20 aminoacylase family protein n=1 Tax=Pseudoroseicyclus sp. CXY001 TaxID=3242492 RepID=UPI00358DCE6A
MPVLNRIAAYSDEMREWRQHLHRHPETRFDCHKTAAFVVERLKEFGVDEIHEGLAESGVVALIHGREPGPMIGLRADMDALPMDEASGKPHASLVPGAMHACGHDGHTTMLLGAARYLAETRNFAGTAVLIFQPAEEWGSGAHVMVDGGLFERWPVNQVFAIHNMPGTPVGTFYGNAGATMAGIDEFEIVVTGIGGHGAYPHLTRDPITAGAAIHAAIQTILSRDHYALDRLVVAVTQFHAGTANNITPEKATLSGTVRSFSEAAQATAKRRLREICAGVEATFGVKVALDYIEWEPPTVNDPDSAQFAFNVAEEVGTVASRDALPEMGGEDFAYMLKAKPGAYIFLGNGDTADVHHPAYDFSDETAPYGASYFARIIERALPVRG